jgi:hypothetical protein
MVVPRRVEGSDAKTRKSAMTLWPFRPRTPAGSELQRHWMDREHVVYAYVTAGFARRFLSTLHGSDAEIEHARDNLVLASSQPDHGHSRRSERRRL